MDPSTRVCPIHVHCIFFALFELSTRRLLAALRSILLTSLPRSSRDPWWVKDVVGSELTVELSPPLRFEYMRPRPRGSHFAAQQSKESSEPALLPPDGLEERLKPFGSMLGKNRNLSLPREPRVITKIVGGGQKQGATKRKPKGDEARTAPVHEKENVPEGAQGTEVKGKEKVHDESKKLHESPSGAAAHANGEEQKNHRELDEPMEGLKRQTRISFMGDNIVEQYNGIKCLMGECRRLANLVKELKQEQKDADTRVEQAQLERDEALEKVKRIEAVPDHQHVEHLSQDADDLSQKLENFKENYAEFELCTKADIEELHNENFLTPATDLRGKQNAWYAQESLKNRKPLQETTNGDRNHVKAGICMAEEKQITWASMRDAMQALQDENELLLSKIEEKTEECKVLLEENTEYSEQVRALADAQDFSKALVQENKELLQQVEGLTSQLSTSLAEDDGLQKEIILVKEALTRTTAEKKVLEDEFSDLKESISALIEQRRASEAIFEKMLLKSEAEKVEEVNLLRSQLQHAEDRCASMQEELATTLAESGIDQEKIWKLEKDLSDSKLLIDTLTAKVQSLEDAQTAKLQETTQKDMGFSACSAAWEKLLAEKDKDITALNDTVIEIEAKNEDLLNELEEAYAFIEGLEEGEQEAHNSLMARLQALESDSFSLSDELYSAREQVTELEREVTRLKGCEDRAAFLAEQHVFLQEQLEDELKYSQKMDRRIQSLHNVSWFLHSKLEEKDSIIELLRHEYDRSTGKLGDLHGALVRELSDVAEMAKALQVELSLAQDRVQRLEEDNSLPSNLQGPSSESLPSIQDPTHHMVSELQHLSDTLTIGIRTVLTHGQQENEKQRVQNATNVSSLLKQLRKLAKRLQTHLCQNCEGSPNVSSIEVRNAATDDEAFAKIVMDSEHNILQDCSNEATDTINAESKTTSTTIDKCAPEIEAAAAYEDLQRNLADLRKQLAEKEETIQQLQESANALRSINCVGACVLSEMQERNQALGQQFDVCRSEKSKLEQENFILKSIAFGTSKSSQRLEDTVSSCTNSTEQDRWAGMYAEENERLLRSLEQASM